MIKANELRIGNILNGGIIVQSIDDTGINTGLRNSCLLVNANPILLTPEILQKVKFGGTIFPSQISISDSGKYYWGNGVNVEIKYLHQLQNLVHSLTGTELEINLNL